MQRNAHIKSLYPTYTTQLDVCPGMSCRNLSWLVDRPNVTTVLTSWSSKPGRGITPHVTTTTQTSLTIAWESPNPNGSPITSYTLERKDNGNFVQVYSGSNLNFVDTGLTARTLYVYRVKVIVVIWRKLMKRHPMAWEMVLTALKLLSRLHFKAPQQVPPPVDNRLQANLLQIAWLFLYLASC